jgi:hypothetical protein
MLQSQIGPISAKSQVASFRNRSIRYLIISGALLVAAIAVGTTIMVGHYRAQALADSERELKNTALILS